jgi:hypothetical protein
MNYNVSTKQNKTPRTSYKEFAYVIYEEIQKWRQTKPYNNRLDKQRIDQAKSASNHSKKIEQPDFIINSNFNTNNTFIPWVEI